MCVPASESLLNVSSQKYAYVLAAFVCIAWVCNVEGVHAAHIEHIKEENGGELPEQQGYDYMNRWAKPFPWGLNTLFFNPHVSPVL